MNISPILLLTIGSIFALGYALLITFGWALTRRNRSNIQKAVAVDYVYSFDLNAMKRDDYEKIKVISLYHNRFLASDGNPINPANFKIYLAKGESIIYPTIKEGNLIFIDKAGNIKFAFDIPDLKDYR